MNLRTKCCFISSLLIHLFIRKKIIESTAQVHMALTSICTKSHPNLPGGSRVQSYVQTAPVSPIYSRLSCTLCKGRAITRWKDMTGENRRTRRITSPNDTSSPSNPIRTDTGANPGLRGERKATNHVSHGTALILQKLFMNVAARVPSCFMKEA
jgi:hypothetical protein